MDVCHLSHNWYMYSMDNGIIDWILECIGEYFEFVQPYDIMYLRAKKSLNGKKTFHIVFTAKGHPVCYLLDLTTGKFKGRYGNRFKFNQDSKFCTEYKVIRIYLDGLDIPDHIPTSKERRRQRNLPSWRIGHQGRKKKKSILLKDFKLH